MINRKQKTIALVLLVAGSLSLLIFFNRESEVVKKLFSKPAQSQFKRSPSPSPTIDVSNQTINGKKVVGLTPGEESQQLNDLKVANEISDDWQEKAQEAIKAQGGSSLKSIDIQPVESFIWVHEGVALNVASTIVTIEDQDGRETIFRALVDAQNGKILRSWDQPINDPVNPREKPGIKLDPRYHQE